MPKSKNDQKILNLQKKVDEKKKALAKAQRFSPTTNCTFLFEGERFNLNTLDVDACTILLIRINAYQMSAENLCIEDPVMISGYNLNDWGKDLMAKLAHLKREAEKQSLRAMESKLKVLLSEDAKTELELDDIAKSLS